MKHQPKTKSITVRLLVATGILVPLENVLAQATSSFSFGDPLGKNQVLSDLATVIITWAFKIGIPIIAAFIIWAGIKFLTARGNQEKVGEAKRMLWWSIVGLAIILIGSGFVALVKSILLIP